MTTPTQPPPAPAPSPAPVPDPGNPPTMRARARNWLASNNAPVNVPTPLPKLLGNRPFIFYMWLTAMIVIGFDEWRNLGVLPRPSRLWSTSLVFGILAVFGSFDTAVPLVNALAFGFVMVLVYQYYNQQGQFSAPPAQGGGTGGAGAPRAA